MREHGRLTAPLGTLELPLVDTGDVGAAAAVALARPRDHAGKTYLLTGPAAVSYAAVAAALTRLTGRAVAYHAIAPEDYLATLLAAGVPEWRAQDLASIASAYAPADNVVTPTLPELLGRPARSLESFLDANRGVFLEH